MFLGRNRPVLARNRAYSCIRMYAVTYRHRCQRLPWLFLSGIVINVPPVGDFDAMNRERLNQNISTIRKYTAAHAELRAAHHFLYDLPLKRDTKIPEVVVMGINPGETEFDRDAYPGPTEETWNFDFHERSRLGRSKGSVRWHNYAEYFANGRPLVMTELFFWSSRNNAEFEERFGLLEVSPHLQFCMNLNRSLIDEYQPKSIIFPGVGKTQVVAKKFGLRHVDTLCDGGKRLVLHYRDESRPWYFTQHWTSAWGLSNTDKDDIRKYIDQSS